MAPIAKGSRPPDAMLRGAVLDEEAVRRIRELRDAGLTHVAIAREIGCSHSTVGLVLRGKAWAWVR